MEDYIAVMVKLAAGFVLARVLGRATGHAMRTASLRYSRFSHRLVATLVFLSFLAWALTDLGINPQQLLNSAGIATLTVGLVARTSLSNFVGGLFLLIERPFSVGDHITVGTLERVFEVEGEVIAVDFISTKLLTAENQIVRLPNTMVMGARITNASRKDRRRATIDFSVKSGTDLSRLQQRLRRHIENRDDFLTETSLELQVIAIAPDSISCQLRFWCEPHHCADNENGIESELLKLLGHDRRKTNQPM